MHPKANEKRYLISFNEEVHWVHLSFDGASKVTMSLVNTSTGDKFFGHTEGITTQGWKLAIDSSTSAVLQSGTIPNELKYEAGGWFCVCRLVVEQPVEVLTNKVNFLIWQNAIVSARGTIVYEAIPSNLTWDECLRRATTAGKRLPTQQEILVNLNGKFRFDSDQWVPVLDAWNEWVSVGNCDTNNRLGRTHTQVTGNRPEWGKTQAPYKFKQFIALTQ
jgi:hypothetical protein